MKHAKRYLALLLVLVLLFSAIPPVRSAKAAETKTLYTFDLEAFLGTLSSSKLQYDYMKLATALQGLVNRSQPQLYFYAMQGDEAKNVGWDMDEYWQQYLSSDGRYLSDYTLTAVTDFWSLFTIFQDSYKGIVLWDEKVPATANVASTIAGVESLLPVRYATDPSDVYSVMLTKGFKESDVKKNLVGMFTGTGTIPDSQTTSTGSAKNDAYIWAKEQYLDKGLTNAELMTYTLDGSSWTFEETATTGNGAKFVSKALPETASKKSIVHVSLSVENTGTTTWSESQLVRLGLKSGDFKLCTSSDGTSTDSGDKNRIKLKNDVAPGETYVFDFYLQVPQSAGAAEAIFQMVQDGVGWFGSMLTHSVTVDDSTAAAPAKAYDATVISQSFPVCATPGSIVPVSITVKNTGTTAWSESEFIRLGLKSGNFKLCTAEDGTSTDSGNQDRIKIKGTVASGETYTFSFYLKVSDTADTYNLQIGMVNDKGSWFDNAYTRSITVAETATEFTSERAWMVLAQSFPVTAAAGSVVPASITVQNVGTATWSETTMFRLGTNSSDFKLCTAEDGTSTDSGSKNRIKLKNNVASGETYTFAFYVQVPDTDGDYQLGLDMIQDGVAWFNQVSNQTISVGDTTVSVSDELPASTPISSSGVTYTSLFLTGLLNADYYIANKAFFWDLSPDATIAPIDDRTQPVGTDVATLKSILLSQAQQAIKRGTDGIYTVGGFVPWFLKYTSSADTQSKLEPVTAEWTMVEIISTYHGQTDADAYGTPNLANGSVFTHVPLNSTLTQNNDKGASSSDIEFDEETAYLCFYMGDWDGAAWVNGILPFIWADSLQDSIDHPDDPLPLAWPINSCLADRIPQIYNMLYETAGSNDYFVTGDNGTGYLNPMFLEGSYVPDGLTNFLDVWKNHNIAANKQFDLDITGFLIESNLSNSTGSTQTVRQAYSEMTPYGVISSNAYDSIVNGSVTTPFVKMSSLSNMRSESERQSAANTIAGNIKFGGQFFIYRSVKATRSNIRDTLELLEAQNPGIKYQVVDPYTFLRLYAEADGGSSSMKKSTYEAVNTAENAVNVDGSVGSAEWSDAAAMTVSKSSSDVSNHGFVWGSFADEADLKSEYRLKWDSDNLYLLEQRTDNAGVRVSATDSPKYDVDATMLFLDLDGKQSGGQFFTGDYAVHYAIKADGNLLVWLRYGNENGMKSHRLLTDDEYTASVTMSSENGNYTVELSIPWSVFDYTPATNATVGMSVLAIDGDPGSAAGRQIMWHGNGDAQTGWGIMKFLGTNAPAATGYVAKITANEQTVKTDETVTLSVNVTNSDFDHFASSEIQLKYDHELLEFDRDASTLNGATVSCSNGVLLLEDYGEDQAFGDAYQLVFKALKKGEASITLTSAAFSDKASSVKSDLTPATLGQSALSITIQKCHSVTLPDIYTGAGTVEDGKDYTFSVKDSEHYSYSAPSATMNGVPVKLTDNGNGSYTISNVTGPLVITGERAPKTYDVTFSGNAGSEVTGGASKGTYGTDYCFTLPSADHYAYQVTSILYENTNTAVPYAIKEGVVTISGDDVKANLVITITKVQTDAIVQVSGSGASDAAGYTSYATPGQAYTLCVTKDPNYVYTVNATLDGTPLKLTVEDGKYTIAASDVTIGTICFTIEKTIDIQTLDVKEYLTVDENQIWLICIGSQKLDAQKYVFSEKDMFWSEKYGAYCYLVISPEKPMPTAADFQIKDGNAIDVSYSGDVNMSEKTDANDAQLVYNIYQSMYCDFTEDVTMEKFLRADVNGDATVNVEDAAAIIAALLKR